MEKDFDAIDKMARDALNNFEVEFNLNDWDRMQDKLDGVGEFDNTFREALQTFSVAFNPSDWSQMENTLDEIYVDQSIKNALEGVEVPLNASHWAMMENTLDKIYVDQPVKDVIQNFEAAFNPEDWEKMEEQLDRKKHLYPHIWLYKSIEAVVMGLILFTLFNFITKPSNSTYQKTNSTTNNNSGIVLNSTNNSNNNNNNVEHNNVSQEFQNGNAVDNNNNEQQNGNSLASTNVGTNNTNSTNNDDNSNNVVGSLNENANTNTNTSSNSINSTNNSAERNSNNNTVGSVKSNNSSNNSSTTKNSKNNNQSQSTNNNAAANTNTKDKQQNTIASGIDNAAENKSTKLTDINKSEISANNSDANANSNNTRNTNQEEKDLATTTNQTTKKEHSLTALQTVDASKTKLVEDPIFELKKLEIPEPYIRQIKIGGLFSPTLDMNTSDGKGGIGYTFGLTVEGDLFKRVSAKMGLIYSQKNYTARNEKIVDNTSVDGASHLVLVDKKTNLFILEIPLYAQYVFFQDDKWRVYATAGLSGNLIVGKEYTGTEKTEYNGVKMSTEINSQDYDEGLFKGGEFLDNVYMTVGGGVGIERQLGDQISLYLLPGYQHTITPIGINKDRINTFSLSVGIKTTIR